jgi:quinoprotein glucose dehydrogenase
MTHPLRLVAPLLLAALPLLSLPASRAGDDDRAAREWRVYGGNSAQTRYSPLQQINRSNVAGLKVAWTFHSGDKRDNPPTTMECNPIVVNGVMYVTSPTLKVIALDAATGQKRWEFDPRQTGQKVSRGVSYWQNGRDRRILFTAMQWLYALDARTGQPVPSFGENGRVDLRRGLDRDIGGQRMTVTTPGTVYQDLLILGSSVGEGPDATAPGHIRAYNVRTGKLAWIFRTIPHPGEFGYETWSPASFNTAGAANAWGGMALDEKRGVVYAATGSPSFDFFGSDRRGDNLFANCVLALDAKTGKRKWHFQTVHHDVWDYDNPCPPVLITVRQEGRKREAVAQVTKTGYVYVLDRDTGTPLFPVEERRVPASLLEDEAASLTQPIPVKPPPFARQGFTEADITDRTPEARESVLKQFRELQGGPVFTPPGEKGLVQMPGFHGGANWSGASFDPTTGRLYVNANDIPVVLTMKANAPGNLYRYGFTGYFRFTDHEGYPAIKPPWGTLTAFDLNRGDLLWRVPIGEYPDLVRRGVRHTGTEVFGGSIVTGGGLVFIAGTKDRKLRALDKATGSVLWEGELETGGNATPSTYEANGRQYVVIAAGGGIGQRMPEKQESPAGDAFIAFALP